MKKIFIPSIIASMFAFTSCTDSVKGINEDPDLLAESDLTVASVSVAAQASDQFAHNTNLVRTAMFWMNQARGAERQYLLSNDWNNSVASDADSQWTLLYKALGNARLAQTVADKQTNAKAKGVFQILEAHCMGTTTSIFGDVPYSEFTYNGKNLTPKYDKQASVYASLQTVLDEAIVNLSKPGKIEGDIFYGGSAAKWTKLAYSLKARYYLHVKDYQKAYDNALKGIDSKADDYVTNFSDVLGQNSNPFYEFIESERVGYMSAEDSYATKLLTVGDALYRGNAKTSETARFNYTYKVGTGETLLNTSERFAINSKMPVVTYGEMLLITTEYHLRKATPDVNAALVEYNNYRALLRSGYFMSATGAKQYDDYVAADFAAGGMENADNINDVTAFLRELYQERYIFNIGNFEAFTDFRRTNNIAEIKLRTFKGVPQRFIYSQEEINANGANVPSPLPKVTDKTSVHN